MKKIINNKSKDYPIKEVSDSFIQKYNFILGVYPPFIFAITTVFLSILAPYAIDAFNVSFLGILKSTITSIIGTQDLMTQTVLVLMHIIVFLILWLPVYWFIKWSFSKIVEDNAGDFEELSKDLNKLRLAKINPQDWELTVDIDEQKGVFKLLEIKKLKVKSRKKK